MIQLNKMLKRELQARADELNIDYKQNNTKAELKEMIKEAESSLESDKEEEKDNKTCPECDGKLVSKKEESSSKGKEDSKVENQLNEKENSQQKKGTLSEAWLDMLKSNRI